MKKRKINKFKTFVVKFTMVKKSKEEKEKRSQKERPKSKTKHKSIQIWKMYEIKNGKVLRKSEFCPRCGNGIFLAKNKNRIWCGKCGYAKIMQ